MNAPASLLFVAALALCPLLNAADTGPKPSAPKGNALHMKRFKETEIKDAFRQMVFQNGINLGSGETYKISFWARASKSLKMRITTKNSAPPWAFFGLREEAKLTNRWKYFEFTFMADEPIPEQSRLTFNYGDVDAADIWVADIRLWHAEAPATPDENLVLNPRFEQGLDKWVAEGLGNDLFIYEVQTLAEVETSGKKK